MRSLGETEVRAWMADQLADRAKISSTEVDLEQPLAAFGLDSLAMLQLLNELEEWIGGSLDMAVLEGNSVSDIARRVVDAAKAAVAAADVPVAATGT